MRFVLLASAGGAVRRTAIRTRQADFFRWVRTNGVPVKDDLWRSLPPEPGRTMALYDLKPQQP